MKKLKRCCAALAVLFFVTCQLAAAQSAQQTDNQAKTTSASAQPSAKKSPDDTNKNKTNGSNNGATPATTAAKPIETLKTPPSKNAGMVWVNTESGVYHKPGSRWYGRTKQGKYMTEADAIKAGYKASGKN